MAKYISAWTVYQGKLTETLKAALNDGEISESDVMWAGPSGDYYVAATPADIEDIEEYADYTDSGTVAEYLH